MSYTFYPPCHMSVSLMSHVEFKKCPRCPVGFRGEGPSDGMDDSELSGGLMDF